MNHESKDFSTDPQVLDIAKEIFISGEPDKPGVLLIHGFTGSPYEMKYLGERLGEKGFTVHGVRLPGHGTNSEDFFASNSEQWLEKATQAYEDLSQKVSKVYVAGLSMGGILSLLLASTFPIERLALAAPAVAVTRKHFTLTPLFSKFVPRTPKVFEPDPNDSPELQELRSRYECYNWVKHAAMLRKMQLRTIRILPKIQSETLIFVSRSDTTVPPYAAKIIEANIGSKKTSTIVLENSSHLITTHVDKERVANEIIDWFSR